MSPTPVSSRLLALELLAQWQKQNRTAADLLDENLHRTDRGGQTADLLYGVIRNQTLLDFLIEQITSVRPVKTSTRQMDILRIGTYELLFCPATADYGILNEAAELAGKNKHQRGFVNAVLRSIQRAIALRDSPAVNAEPRCFVYRTAQAGCLLAKPLLPDPDSETIRYFSTVFSLPEWLIETWLAEYGPEKTLQICLGSNRHPEMIAQPNTLKTTAARLAQTFQSEGVQADLSPDQSMVRLHTNRPLTDLWSFQKGHFVIQDPSASKVARLADPAPGATVIDLCAAPGGKTAGLAMCMNNTGRIIASDIDAARLKKVDESCARLGITCVTCTEPDNVRDALGRKNKAGMVLLDVPCSNTGVLARRIEVRHRLKPAALKKITRTQKELLNQAANLVRKHGTLVYSTCSILPDENENLIAQFCAENPRFHKVNEELTLPSPGDPIHFPQDGAYAAILKKQ